MESYKKGRSGICFFLEERTYKKGGNSCLFRATFENDQGKAQPCVLKEIRNWGDAKEQEKRQKRFENEIHFLKEHGNLKGIPRLIDYDEEMKWFAMPRYQGVRKSEFKSGKEILEFFVETTKILKGIDDGGIVHRDIKPSNILYRKANDGVKRPIVADFGLVFFPGSTFTEPLEKIGSFNFTAPELLVMATGKTVTAAADIYALAKTIWAILSNSHFAFPGKYDRTWRGHQNKQLENVFGDCECLEPLVELLEESTQDDFEKRPNFDRFLKLLADQIAFLSGAIEQKKKDYYLFRERFFNAHSAQNEDEFSYRSDEKNKAFLAGEKLPKPIKIRVFGKDIEGVALGVEAKKVRIKIANFVLQANAQRVTLTKQAIYAEARVDGFEAPFMQGEVAIGDTITIVLWQSKEKALKQ